MKNKNLIYKKKNFEIHYFSLYTIVLAPLALVKFINLSPTLSFKLPYCCLVCIMGRKDQLSEIFNSVIRILFFDPLFLTLAVLLRLDSNKQLIEHLTLISNS